MSKKDKNIKKNILEMAKDIPFPKGVETAEMKTIKEAEKRVAETDEEKTIRVSQWADSIFSISQEDIKIAIAVKTLEIKTLNNELKVLKKVAKVFE